MKQMLKLIRYAIAVLAILTVTGVRAGINARSGAVRDSLEAVLPSQHTPDDRIRTLYNIFDLSVEMSDRDHALDRLYKEASAANKPEVQLDALVHLANIHRDSDSILAKIENELEKFVETDQCRETKLFVAMSRSDIRSKTDNNKDNQSHLGILFKRENISPSSDPYERALMLYTLCTHLSKTTRGELLEEYVSRLEKHISGMNLPSGWVRNLIYTRAAPVFTNNQNYKKAVEIDKKIINIIDSLSDIYESQGRPYRDLATSRFSCYRRLLGNYKGLSDGEVELIYRRILELAKEDVRVANDLNVVERSKIFYDLATGNYAEAVKGIKRQINNPANKDYRLYFLNALVEAAEKTGDKQTQLEAAVELNGMWRDELERRAAERFRELEIIYDVNDLKEANAVAEKERLESRTRAVRIFAAALVVVIVAMILLLVSLYRKNRKIKQVVAQQARTAGRLRSERNELRQAQQELIVARDKAKSADKIKTDFIDNMSHEVKAPLSAIVEYSKVIVDCVPEDKNPYLKRFANIIELNSKLIMTLVNDVLDIASLEHGSMNVALRPSSVYEMCVFALDNLFEEEGVTGKGVKVVFNTAGRQDAVVNTDPQRVAQVLINLLGNADKFTDKGTISLEFEHDKELGKVEFIVTDTGIGVAKGEEEAIFSRFHQLDSSASGCGLGLYISRLLAKLLGGDVRLDTSYRGGARFIFTISDKA